MAWAYAVAAIGGHVMLTRLRVGWHIMAIGGSRRSAYNAGIAVRRTVALSYVACGMLTAVASRLAKKQPASAVSMPLAT